MNIEHILKKKGAQCHRIDPDKPLTEAVASMMECRVGSLLVFDEQDQLAGIVTERDVLRAVHRFGADLSGVKVKDVMAQNLVTCAPGDSVDDIMERMLNNPTEKRIRHLPVMDGGVLKGIISIGDVVDALLTETRFENRLLRNYVKNWPDE